jgi:HEPN domain-containing protein
MADFSVVKEWLDKADDDFRFAEANLKDGSEFYAQLCFHFQQSAEKYLKAFIIGKNLKFDRVHDLVHLLKTCSTHAPEFSCLKEECILLNTAYIETRYPVHWPTEYSRDAAEEACNAAANIARMVRGGLGL